MVLIVDDDEDIRETLALLLGAYGFRTATACDGVDALALLQDGVMPDVLLVDLMMPRMNGQTLLAELAHAPALAAIPRVILSGDASARDTATALGAIACITKPVDLEDLLATLHRALGATQPQPHV
jgi:CheY-like chemotaxis protein